LSPSVRTTRLENGIRVVTESVRDVASAAIGLWVENGSRYESARTNGISHFIEHLLFKGTATRSAQRVAEEIERLGGSINAFTTKEHTCYHTRTLHEDVETALDVLGDIFLHSAFRPEDVELEREVVLQEIYDSEDSPEDYVHDYFHAMYWPGHPLGWTVTGTAETVRAIRRDDILAFVDERYRPDRVIVAAAGRIDHDHVVDLCRKRLLDMRGSYEHPAGDRPDFSPGLFVSHRDLEQVHVVIGLPGVSIVDPRRETAEVLLTALGGGMSSRLFQTVREERGLAYSIYGFQCPFRDIGYTGVYAATSREGVRELVELVLAELSRVRAEGLTADELDRTKGQLIGSIPLALESTESRMYRIARNQMYFAREVPVEETIDSIRAVSNDDVLELAHDVFGFERLGIALVGDAEEDLVSLPAR
jgi:predicted Zn-dependent peptidase